MTYTEVKKQVRKFMRFKNVVVQYTGGGYDGCFHEDNFVYIDDYGKFWSIKNTGVLGASDKNMLATRIEEILDGNRGKYQFFRLYIKKDMKAFNEENAYTILLVGRWLEETMDITIESPCDLCNKVLAVNDLIPADNANVGGVVIQPQLKICEDCRDSHTCAQCDEFFEDNDDFDGSGLCEECQIENASMSITDLSDYIESEEYYKFVAEKLGIPQEDDFEEDHYLLLKEGKEFDIDNPRHVKLSVLFLESLGKCREERAMAEKTEKEIREELHPYVQMAVEREENDNKSQLNFPFSVN